MLASPEPEPEPGLPPTPIPPGSSSSHGSSARGRSSTSSSRSPRSRSPRSRSPRSRSPRLQLPVAGQTHGWPTRKKPGPRCLGRCVRTSLRYGPSIVGLQGKICAAVRFVSNVMSYDCCCMCRGWDEHPEYKSGKGGKRTPKCVFHCDHARRIMHTCGQCLHLVSSQTPQDLVDAW
jgi:hypothetical protein